MRLLERQPVQSRIDAPLPCSLVWTEAKRPTRSRVAHTAVRAQNRDECRRRGAQRWLGATARGQTLAQVLRLERIDAGEDGLEYRRNGEHVDAWAVKATEAELGRLATLSRRRL